MTDDLEKARQKRKRRQATKPAGAFGLGGAKKRRADEVMAKVDAAAERRDQADYYAGRAPTPDRITSALNIRGLYGPEVDEALGGVEPMVDEWESGERVPTFAQVKALAVLTGFPVRFFYQPPGPSLAGGIMCGPGGCTPV